MLALLELALLALASPAEKIAIALVEVKNVGTLGWDTCTLGCGNHTWVGHFMLGCEIVLGEGGWDNGHVSLGDSHGGGLWIAQLNSYMVTLKTFHT